MKFEIGEIAYAYRESTNEWNECEIVGGLGTYQVAPNKFKSNLYLIKIEGYVSHVKSGYWSVPPYKLKKKQPPQELGSYEALKDIWIPNRNDLVES